MFRLFDILKIIPVGLIRGMCNDPPIVVIWFEDLVADIPIGGRYGSFYANWNFFKLSFFCPNLQSAGLIKIGFRLHFAKLLCQLSSLNFRVRQGVGRFRRCVESKQKNDCSSSGKNFHFASSASCSTSEICRTKCTFNLRAHFRRHVQPVRLVSLRQNHLLHAEPRPRRAPFP